jgi:hypothetical protein
VTGGLRRVAVTRYVTPLREGGSLPGLVEAEDLGTYVLKFRGAGQGRKALVSEVIAGELARRLGFPVPALALADLDPELARAEPDPEIQDLLRASAGLNLAVDYLPGSVGFEPVAFPPDPAFAAQVLWFDALVQNVDRSWRNPNLVVWHGRTYLIDHGAALYVHHSWPARPGAADLPYGQAEEHVLLPYAGELEEVDADLSKRVTPRMLGEVLDLVPDEWLADEPGFAGPDDLRAAYVAYLTDRVAAPRPWVEALEVTRAARV